jgi:hypothetical protein
MRFRLYVFAGGGKKVCFFKIEIASNIFIFISYFKNVFYYFRVRKY